MHDDQTDQFVQTAGRGQIATEGIQGGGIGFAAACGFSLFAGARGQRADDHADDKQANES